MRFWARRLSVPSGPRKRKLRSTPTSPSAYFRMALALLMRALGLDRRGRLVAIASPQQDFLAIRWDGCHGERQCRSCAERVDHLVGLLAESHHTLDALERIGETSFWMHGNEDRRRDFLGEIGCDILSRRRQQMVRLIDQQPRGRPVLVRRAAICGRSLAKNGGLSATSSAWVLTTTLTLRRSLSISLTCGGLRHRRPKPRFRARHSHLRDRTRAELELALGHSFGERRRQCRLADTRAPGNQHAAAIGFEECLLAVAVGSDKNPVPGRRDDASIAARDLLDQLDDPGAARAPEPDVGGILDHRQRIGDCRRASASPEEGMIVLGIADAHNIVRRQLQLLGAAASPVALLTPAGSTMTAPLLKMICNSSPSSRMVSSTAWCGSHVATIDLPTETGSTFLAASLAMKLSDGGGAIARSSSLAGS